MECLEAFVEQHRARLKERPRAYGPGSRPASHGRYALVGQRETAVILERMETRSVRPARSRESAPGSVSASAGCGLADLAMAYKVVSE